MLSDLPSWEKKYEVLDWLKDEVAWNLHFPRTQYDLSSYGREIRNGFDLSGCGGVIEQFLQILYPLSDKEKTEEVLDFIFKPDKDPATSEEEVTLVYNRTRASMELLQALALESGISCPKDLIEHSSEVMEELKVAFERMGPPRWSVKEEERQPLYPSLRSEIEKIVKREKGN